MAIPLTIRRLGLTEYAKTFASMNSFTDTRGPETPDEFWCVQHQPVYTLGLNADRSHVLASDAIPVLQVDRGGQVTYHGPGQLVVYTLLDLKRANLGIRDLVSALENAMIATVADFGVTAINRRDAPGIYVAGAKLGSIGLRIRRGCSYHGLSLNIDMDLSPFQHINTCGFENLSVTQLRDLAEPPDIESIATALTGYLASILGFSVREE
jgi:lipoyl(octanoyl) transferase